MKINNDKRRLTMNDEEKQYFESCKKDNISTEDLKKGEQKAGKLGNLKNDFLTLISMVKDTAKGDFRLTGIELATIIGAIAYVVLPIDAIPDLIPLAGFGDDIGVVGLVLKQVSDAIERYKNQN